MVSNNPWSTLFIGTDDSTVLVWCWGWDGAGDLDGPDVEPIWEKMPNITFDNRQVRHDRSFAEL